MSIRDAVILAAVAVMSVSADAVTRPATTLTSSGMAVIDGMLDNCRRVDPIRYIGYTLAITNITQGHNLGELIGIRASAQYQTVLAGVNSDLKKQSVGSQISSCKAFLAGR